MSTNKQRKNHYCYLIIRTQFLSDGILISYIHKWACMVYSLCYALWNNSHHHFLHIHITQHTIFLLNRSSFLRAMPIPTQHTLVAIGTLLCLLVNVDLWKYIHASYVYLLQNQFTVINMLSRIIVLISNVVKTVSLLRDAQSYTCMMIIDNSLSKWV